MFEMQRFDPTAEDDDSNIIANDLKLPSKLKLKRKLAETEGTSDDVKDQKRDSDGQPAAKKKKKKNKKKQSDEEIQGFTILGDPTDKSVKKVSRVLPYWLSHPDIVTVDLHSSPLAVSDMSGLDKALVERLAKEKIKTFFPVQRQVIPHLLEYQPRFRPSDVCVSAPTGSGKTLAFVLPIVSALRDRMVPRVRCIAVLPTQELASQVYSVFNVYTAGTKLKVKLLTGGDSVAGEASLVRRGVGDMVHQLYDILVVTPGRLTHTIKECPNLDLSHLRYLFIICKYVNSLIYRYLVIDEADRMMENIAHDWLNILEAAVYTRDRVRPGLLTVNNAYKPSIPLQKLLFSATLSHDPEQLEQLNLFEPKLYRCVVPVEGINSADTAQSLPTTLHQQFTLVQQTDKPLMVHHLLTSLKLTKALIFTHSNETVHRLSLLLANLGHKVGALHSNVANRKKVLNSLARGATNVVVCSDVLARGIDLEDLDGVISYDVPAFLKTYIHRAGRTARAGNDGRSVTMCEDKQVKSFLKMLKEGNILDIEELKVDTGDLETYREDYKLSLEKVKEQLHAEKSGGSNNSDHSKNGNKKKQKRKNKFSKR